MFERYSQRARRVIFWSLQYSRLAGSGYIEPEHILEGLLQEDPALFRLIQPEKPGIVSDLQAQLAAKRGSPITEKRDTPLSPPAKAVVVAAAAMQDKFGHAQIANQHLLLALLTAPAPSSSWFGKKKEWPVQTLLVEHGITIALVEEKTRTGVITTTTWVLDDAVNALNAQIGALADLLISKGLFTRAEYISSLDQHEGPLPPQSFLLPFIDSLTNKGILSEAERQTLNQIAEKKSDDNPPSEI
jgi:hypothetical protein